jgi:hypothetical protein
VSRKSGPGFKGLSPKQKAFIRLWKESPDSDPTEIARKAGYAPNTIHNLGVNVVNRCREHLQKELEDAGINAAELRRKLAEGLQAFTVKEFVDRQGVVIRAQPLPDYGTRHRYLETVLKVQGVLTDKVEVSGGLNNTHASVNLTQDEEERLKGELGVLFTAKRRGKR